MSDADAPFIACHRLSRWYGDVIAVNALDVTIPEGITGLLGPNGSGKTSLMRMTMGLIRPSSGHLSVLGADPWNNQDLLRRIGYVPEAPAPWRDLTGHAALMRGANMAGLEGSAAGSAVDDALQVVGLGDAAERAVGGYSHGMQQRLKFALAILNDPDALILDEPLIGTDPLARRDLIRLMKSQVNEGRSILLSTHVLSDVEQLTQDILLLRHGRLMAHGDVHAIRDVLDQYPRTVRIATTAPRELGAAIWQLDGIDGIEHDEHGLTVRSHDATDLFENIQALLIERDLPFTSITSPDDNVEAVFRYLVN